MANLSFKLLIDYPPQITKYRSREDFHKKVSEFFAFGGKGSPTDSLPNLSQLEEQIVDLNKQKDDIKPTKALITPSLPFGSELTFYFPNDFPSSGSESFAISNIIASGYEDGYTNPSTDCDKDWGLNAEFVGLIDSQIEKFLNPKPNTSNYNSEENYANIDFVDIEIVSSATKLFKGKNEAEYNKRLSERRANALIAYIEQRFKDI
jgi:hypothetical protein